MLKFSVKYVGSVIILFVLLVCTHAKGQNKGIDLTAPDLTLYDLSDGFSTQCFEKTFQDATGLLWLKTCPYVGKQFNHHFTTFDGHRSNLPKLTGDQIPNGSVVQALDMTESGVIYGVYANRSLRENGLFLLNTSRFTMRVIESSETGSELPIVTCQIDGEEMVLLCANTSGFDIYRFNIQVDSTRHIVGERYSSKTIAKRSQRLSNPFSGRFIDGSYLRYYKGMYWVLGGGLPFYKYDEHDSVLTKIELAELGETYASYAEEPYYHPYLIPRSQGDFILVLGKTERGVLRYDFDRDSFSEVPALFSLSTYDRAGSSKSATPKDLVVLRYSTKSPERCTSLLLHSDGSIDSLIVREGSKYAYHVFQSEITGNTLISTDVGLFVLPSESQKSAKSYLKSMPTRGLLPIDDHRLLVSMSSKHIPMGIFNLETEVLDNDYFDSDFEGAESCKLMKRKDGKIWVPDDPNIGLIDVENKTINQFPNPFEDLKRYDLRDDSTLIVLHEGGLYAWNPESKKQQLLYFDEEIKRETGHIHDIHIAENGDVYCALTSGLLRIKRDWQSHSIYGRDIHYDDLRILSLAEDDKGRLWLGTYASGIYVFDPKTETFETIKIADGLLSNSIASLEFDQKKHMWAGTFNGVSRIDVSILNVTNTLTKSDGLANNESNRFSAGRFDDGRIVMGSIAGFSVIDTEHGSLESFQENRAELFISAASWRDSKLGERIVFNTSAFGDVSLSAESPNVRLVLAISNYLAPSLHSFKYKIGRGNWQLASSNRSLYLNGLAPGDYNIQIKGIDSLGQETRNTLKIPISVMPFFYQEWWFFVLCALPFVLFLIAWMRRQRKMVRLQIIEVQSEQLQELNQLKTRFFANISHEFRTPLSVISGMTSTLKHHSDEKVKSALQLIHKNSTILLNLINQILDLVKLESKEIQVDYIQSDIIAYLNQVCDSVRPLADSKSIILNTSYLSEQLNMDFDKNKIYRILVNLLSNAIKFTPQGGQIEIICKRQKNAFTFKVMDTGIGIPTDKLPFIFDRFYQVDSSTTREGEGVGIGLNLTKELVLLLGGRIDVKSKEGIGTTFTVHLPITNHAQIDAVSKLDVPSSIVLIDQGMAAIKGEETENIDDSELPLVLLIEDNRDITQVLSEMLSDRYRVETALNGQLGIDKAISLVPDIILSDVMMPVKDGIQVVDELKNNILTSHIPIMLLTAKADLKSRLEGLRRGADEYLSKPFHEEELLLRMKNLLIASQRIHARYVQGAPAEVSKDPENTLEDTFIIRIQKVLEDNIDNAEYAVSDFCTELGVSRTQLHKKVKALTGLSTTAYVKSLRLLKAKKLLLSTQLTISEIAFKVGFSSASYFSRTFAADCGCSPSDFRFIQPKALDKTIR